MKIKNLAFLLLLSVGLTYSFGPLLVANAQTEDDTTTVEDDTEVTTDDTTTVDEEVDMDVDADTDEMDADEEAEVEDPALDGDDDTELYNDEVEVTEEEVTGEVIEITEDYIVIETEDGEQVQLSRNGGGGLLSPFVRQANLGNLAVGDQVTATVTREAVLQGLVSGVQANGSLTVVTSDGETRTISPNSTDVIVRQNGKVVTDFSTLSEGDEVEVVFPGEIVSDVDTVDAAKAGWIIPVIVILIVLALAAVLAKRGNREEL